jgi:multidrug transporter EmrE-like cation transporter
MTAWLLFGDKVSLLGILGIGLIIVTGTVVAIRSNEPGT